MKSMIKLITLSMILLAGCDSDNDSDASRSSCTPGKYAVVGATAQYCGDNGAWTDNPFKGAIICQDTHTVTLEVNDFVAYCSDAESHMMVPALGKGNLLCSSPGTYRSGINDDGLAIAWYCYDAAGESDSWKDATALGALICAEGNTLTLSADGKDLYCLSEEGHIGTTVGNSFAGFKCSNEGHVYQGIYAAGTFPGPYVALKCTADTFALFCATTTPKVNAEGTGWGCD